MKLLFAFFLLICFILSSACKQPSTIYLVRHAEKADTTRDPDLSEAGRQRADRLASLLKNEKINAIYSTNYKRTIQTASPLGQLTNQTILFYSSDSLPALANKLRSLHQNILVVGHSNTTISLLDAFGLHFSRQKIADNDYSNLFKITSVGKKSNLKLEELKY